MIAKTVTIASALTLLVTGCVANAVDPGAGPSAEHASPAEEGWRICVAPVAPAAADTAVWDDTFSWDGKWVGTRRVSPMPYGTACTADYMVETTGTTGKDVALEGQGYVDAATNANPSACAASTIVAEAWGGSTVANQADGFTTNWSSLGKVTTHGIFHSTIYGKWCELTAQLPTVVSSPYSQLRLGVRATNAAGAKVQVVDSIGYQMTPTPK